MPRELPAANIEAPTDDQLLRQIEAAEATIAVAKRNADQAKAELVNRRKSEIEKLLKAKDEPFGDITLIVGNRQIKVNIPKKVKWDNKKLSSIYTKINEDGADPDEYIDVEFSVSETKYKAWPEDLKKEFLPARTVTPGNPSLKIKEDKE